jgi:cysteine synthase
MPPLQASASVLDAIGNTPVVKLRRLLPASSAEVLVKLEYISPTGSYKDRLALAMIAGAERRGVLKPGMRVVEYTGGSTGSSLGTVCAVKGYPFMAVTSDAFSGEKLATMRAFGAELHIISSDHGKITPELFDVMLGEVHRLSQEPGNFYTNQFRNEDAVAGYMPIGRELLGQVGPDFDVFCGAVGPRE